LFICTGRIDAYELTITQSRGKWKKTLRRNGKTPTRAHNKKQVRLETQREQTPVKGFRQSEK